MTTNRFLIKLSVIPIYFEGSVPIIQAHISFPFGARVQNQMEFPHTMDLFSPTYVFHISYFPG